MMNSIFFTLSKADLLSRLSGIVCLTAYASLIVGILKSKIEQSFAAFLLWGMLDTIATVTTVLAHGNFWLPLGNAAGSTVIALLLIAKKQITWSWIETMTTILVIVCLIVWHEGGERLGIVASSLAVVIASFPQMVETYKKPAATPLKAYLIFLLANILSFIAGRHWTVEERFYSGCSIFLCVAIVLLSMRKTHN